MNTPKDILGRFSGGRVLDVATGSGGFIHFLIDGLQDYTEITGIDTNERLAAAFEGSFQGNPHIHFQHMDALEMDFPDQSFDTVSISNSLHHFDDPRSVLRQMQRVLRPGGQLILAEMYCDGQAETQLTHVFLHHWWAAIDRANGLIHNETYRREELVALLTSLGWQALEFYDLSETEADPRQPEIQAELAPVIDRYIQRASGHPDLQARGEELLQRIQEIGFHGATTLLVVATNP